MINKLRPLQLGIIGGGLNSVIGQTHFNACRMDGSWEIVAGAFSRDQQVNAKSSHFWQINPSRCYDKWQELLTNEGQNLDALVILSPSPSHGEMMIEAFDREIPVICEKPIVVSTEQLEAIKKVFNPQKHFLALTYNYSGYPMLRELRAQLNKNTIGTVNKIHIEMPQDIFVKCSPLDGKKVVVQTWRKMSTEIPMICLDLGVHLHHLLFFLLGIEPKKLMANFQQTSEKIDAVEMWLKYQNNIEASISFSKNTFGSRNSLSIKVNGDKGAFFWQQEDCEHLTLYDAIGRIIILDRGSCSMEASKSRYDRMKIGHPAGYLEAFANVYQDISLALRQWRETRTFDNEFVYGLEHAADSIHFFAKAVLSDQLKMWIDIDD